MSKHAILIRAQTHSAAFYLNINLQIVYNVPFLIVYAFVETTTENSACSRTRTVFISPAALEYPPAMQAVHTETPADGDRQERPRRIRCQCRWSKLSASHKAFKLHPLITLFYQLKAIYRKQYCKRALSLVISGDKHTDTPTHTHTLSYTLDQLS
jgi:hypothetical protein